MHKFLQGEHKTLFKFLHKHLDLSASEKTVIIRIIKQRINQSYFSNKSEMFAAGDSNLDQLKACESYT